MKYFVINEEISCTLKETDFRSNLIERIKFFQNVSKLRDLSVDSLGFIHCSPSGITDEKGVHVIAKLNFNHDVCVLSINYTIINIQKYLIIATIIFNFIFVSSLLVLYFLGKFSNESVFFKLLVGLPILLTFTVLLLYFSFKVQVNKISMLLNSVEKKVMFQ
jgi:hypothetical protein